MFPVEIYLWILKKADNATVRACVLVSREFYGIATEVLQQRRALRNAVTRVAAHGRRRKRLPYTEVPLAEMCSVPMGYATHRGSSLGMTTLAYHPELLGCRFITRCTSAYIPRYCELLEDIVVHHEPGQANFIMLHTNGPPYAVEVTRLSPCATRLRPEYPIIFYPLHTCEIRGVMHPFWCCFTMIMLNDPRPRRLVQKLNDGTHGSHRVVHEYLMSLCKKSTE